MLNDHTITESHILKFYVKLLLGKSPCIVITFLTRILRRGVSGFVTRCLRGAKGPVLTTLPILSNLFEIDWSVQ